MRREYAPHLSAEKLREGVVGGSLHVVSRNLQCTAFVSPLASHSSTLALLAQGRMHIDRLDPRNGSIIISSNNQTVKIMGRRSINRAIEGDTGDSHLRTATRCTAQQVS
jgi:hypothetical protein